MGQITAISVDDDTAAIGSRNETACGDIVIDGGYIEARGEAHGAGIGGGGKGSTCNEYFGQYAEGDSYEQGEFLGWYLNGETYDFSEPVDEDTVIIAKWRIADRLNVSVGDGAFEIATLGRDAGTGTVVAALYDNGGRLIQVWIFDPAEEPPVGTFTEDNGTLRVFWLSENGIPLCEAVSKILADTQE